MCGTAVSQGGLSAPEVWDEVPTDSPSPGPTVTAYPDTLFLVSRGCGAGADITFSRAEVTIGPVAYAKDGKPVIFAVSSVNAPRDVVMTVTAKGHTRSIHLVVTGPSGLSDTSTTGFSGATSNP